MAHHIDWDNIHLHIHDADVRYKRRLLRKQLYIECSPSITSVSPANGSLKKLKSVKDQISMENDELVVACPNVVSYLKPIKVNYGCKRNDVDPDVEIFMKGFMEGGKSLVCKVDDNASHDVNLMKLENGQDRKFLCNDVDTDLEIIEEGLEEGGRSLVCRVEDNASDDVNLMKLENGQDRKFLCNDVDPDVEIFMEGFMEGERSLVCRVEDNASDDVNLMKLENVQDQKFMCNDVDTDMEIIKEGLGEGGRSLVCRVGDYASDDVNLMKLENVQERKYLCNDVDTDMEIIKEGLGKGGRSLCDDVSLMKLENVQDREFLCNDELVVTCPNVVLNPKPISMKYGGKRNDADPDMEMFKEGLREGGQSLICKVEDNASEDVSLKKLEYVQDQKSMCDDEFWIECSNVVKEDLKEERHLFASSDVGIKKLGSVQDQDLRNDELRVKCRDHDVKFGAKRMIVDPDLKKFLEAVKVDGHSYGLNVKKSDGSSVSLKYEKAEQGMEYQRRLKGDDIKYVLGKQKGDDLEKLGNNLKKEKWDKFLPRVDVNLISTKEKRNVMFRREGFSRNTNRSPVTLRASVVKKRDNVEIISIGKPNEIEEVTTSKNNRPLKIIKNKRKRPVNLDNGCNIEHLRNSESKKKYEKVERRPCLERFDHVSNLMDTARKLKKHYRRRSPRNKQRDLVVQQGEDIENSRTSSGIRIMDVMVKEEKFDDSMNVVVKKRRQMIQGKDSVHNNNYMVKEEKFDDSMNVVVKKRRQMIQGKDSVHDNNVQPLYKCDKKFGKYAEVKEENANSLNYNEEDNEQSSDLEILEMDNEQISSKFEVMKVFNTLIVEDNPLSIKSPSDYGNSEFRHGLMDILRRPFDLEEYRSLMQKAKYRHLMGGPEYSDGLKEKGVTSTYGKSPLDYHPGVHRRLRQCRKISKRLNILRGFIYWYGRTCQDGAFKPWLDKSCSTVTPRPR